MLKLLLIYVLLINLIGFYIMYNDKKRAKQGRYRIPEKTLWKVAFIGGAMGSWLGLKVFRHKTKHSNFKFGFPILSIVELVIFIYIGFIL